ncbi:Oxygen-regulated invasion protein OrgB [Chromobacterium violaceum]|uniref:Oxygen-regulated invasion protein OrgB n=1 Tax=Chromobacterium violaceum TaxID=536 RepID=A0AAX2M8H7_CHRVL|nr:type III secretion system linker protein OrgB [Chromobacterium violaceum]MBT2867655.1 type III secretion system linker protein OrgB [Chromobacterium violaceum]OLZ76449.1 hypothetical protein BS642_16190 [Chromobacterium violaceum]STB63774.1 Oxygen-regulated invasion protein OrgB [Chromobacterium violaceum]SUX32439.1 Oxygen-regulated invasion protein OrgB [Chromobacterium violaceum]
MPRDIPIFRPPNAIEGVLVCREQLLRHDKAVSLEREARRHAARIVRQAEQEAESLRGRALLDGYGDGMIQALGQLARHLANGDALLRHCRERLEAESRAMLSAAVDHPDALLLALDEWLRERRREDESRTLHLLLPQQARASQAELMALLAESWGGRLSLDYHPDSRFVMRCGEQAAEFSPELYVEPASSQAMQALGDLPSRCRGLSAAALSALRDELDRMLADQENRETETC